MLLFIIRVIEWGATPVKYPAHRVVAPQQVQSWKPTRLYLTSCVMSDDIDPMTHCGSGGLLPPESFVRAYEV